MKFNKLYSATIRYDGQYNEPGDDGEGRMEIHIEAISEELLSAGIKTYSEKLPQVDDITPTHVEDLDGYSGEREPVVVTIFDEEVLSRSDEYNE